MGPAPPVSAEKPVMAVQPYKAGFGFYLQSHVCFVFGLGAVVQWSPRGETVLNGCGPEVLCSSIKGFPPKGPISSGLLSTPLHAVCFQQDPDFLSRGQKSPERAEPISCHSSVSSFRHPPSSWH